MGISGVLHGAREAYHADPYVFERGFGAAPESFWGHDAWKRNYYGNDPNRPHKHEFFANVGRDVWHTANFGDKLFLISGTFWLGARDKPRRAKIIGLLAGVLIRSAAATATYQMVRKF